jgi:hypothetical protein
MRHLLGVPVNAPRLNSTLKVTHPTAAVDSEQCIAIICSRHLVPSLLASPRTALGDLAPPPPVDRYTPGLTAGEPCNRSCQDQPRRQGQPHRAQHQHHLPPRVLHQLHLGVEG